MVDMEQVLGSSFFHHQFHIDHWNSTYVDSLTSAATYDISSINTAIRVTSNKNRLISQTHGIVYF